MAAILKPAGDSTSGVQAVGVVKQYLVSGTGSSASTAETILPGDGSSDGNSGSTILGTVPPGQAGLRQVVPVIQRAAVILADSTSGAVGNALLSSPNVNADPTPPTGSADTDGLSQAPQHE